MRSAKTIERPSVTSVWRRSCPSMRRKIRICISDADGRDDDKRDDEAEQPRAASTRRLVADIAAEQIERAVRQIDVAHEPEDQREAAGDEEIKAAEGDAVEHAR